MTDNQPKAPDDFLSDIASATTALQDSVGTSKLNVMFFAQSCYLGNIICYIEVIAKFCCSIVFKILLRLPSLICNAALTL